MFKMLGKIVDAKTDAVLKVIVSDSLGNVHKLTLPEFADILHEVDNVIIEHAEIQMKDVPVNSVPLFDEQLRSVKRGMSILGVLICQHVRFFRVLSPDGKCKLIEERKLIDFTKQKKRNALLNARVRGNRIVPKYGEFTELLYSASTALDLDYDILVSGGYICRGGLNKGQVRGRVFLSDKVTGIAADAFKGCTELTAITAPNVRVIGTNAFYNCKSLTAVWFTDSLTDIGIGAFYNCISLTSVALGNNLRFINEYVFAKCVSLKKFDIPRSIVAIGAFAFLGCFSLAHIAIGQKVKHIGVGAFMQCNALQTIILPNSLEDTVLSRSLFQDCSKINNIVIPKQIKSMDKDVFRGCSSLQTLYSSKELGEEVKYLNRECKCIYKQ